MIKKLKKGNILLATIFGIMVAGISVTLINVSITNNRRVKNISNWQTDIYSFSAISDMALDFYINDFNVITARGEKGTKDIDVEQIYINEIFSKIDAQKDTTGAEFLLRVKSATNNQKIINFIEDDLEVNKNFNIFINRKTNPKKVTTEDKTIELLPFAVSVKIEGKGISLETEYEISGIILDIAQSEEKIIAQLNAESAMVKNISAKFD